MVDVLISPLMTVSQEILSSPDFCSVCWLTTSFDEEALDKRCRTQATNSLICPVVQLRALMTGISVLDGQLVDLRHSM